MFEQNTYVLYHCERIDPDDVLAARLELLMSCCLPCWTRLLRAMELNNMVIVNFVGTSVPYAFHQFVLRKYLAIFKIGVIQGSTTIYQVFKL